MVEAGTGVGKSFAYLIPAAIIRDSKQHARHCFDKHHQPSRPADPERSTGASRSTWIGFTGGRLKRSFELSMSSAS